MSCKNWCNNNSGMKPKLFTFTLIVSFLLTTALANDQRTQLNPTNEKLTGQKNSEGQYYLDDGDEDVEGSGRDEIRDDLRETDEGDDENSGSGYGPDDEDDFRPGKDKTNLSKDPTINTHHSGDGSIPKNNIDDDTVDYDQEPTIQRENHNMNHNIDRKPPPPLIEEPDIYFDNSTNTDTDLIGPTTTDDENIGGDFNSNKKNEDSNRGSDLDVIHPTPIVPVIPDGNDVLIMNTKDEDRPTSFFAQPGMLAAVIGGAVVGLLFAILVVMFIVYRMRKKDEGSYALDEPKRSPQANSYTKNHNNREFYA